VLDEDQDNAAARPHAAAMPVRNAYAAERKQIFVTGVVTRMAS
jgi:hypothetical protein